MITADDLRDDMTYDPLTGDFRRRRTVPGPKPRERAELPRRYRWIMVRGRNYPAHRLAWLYVHGYWPEGVIDHINGDPTDNRIVNLRDIPAEGNAQNQHRAHSNNRTGRIGVELLSSGRWRARILVAGRYRHLGVFDLPDEATAAYWEAKREFHPYSTAPAFS